MVTSLVQKMQAAQDCQQRANCWSGSFEKWHNCWHVCVCLSTIHFKI